MFILFVPGGEPLRDQQTIIIDVADRANGTILRLLFQRLPRITLTSIRLYSEDPRQGFLSGLYK